MFVRLLVRTGLACVLGLMAVTALAAPQCRDITGFEQHALHAPGFVVSDMHGFAGQVHARKTQGLTFIGAPPDAKDAQPLGYRLKDRGFVHLGISYAGGSIWTCMPSGCGVQQGGTPGPAVRSFSITASDDPAYDAMYDAGRLTASRPAAPVGTNPTPQTR